MKPILGQLEKAGQAFVCYASIFVRDGRFSFILRKTARKFMKKMIALLLSLFAVQTALAELPVVTEKIWKPRKTLPWTGWKAVIH